MKKKILLIFFSFFIGKFIYSFDLGVSLIGGAGWGGGVYTAYEGYQINPLYKGPYSDTAACYDYGFLFYFFDADFPNLVFNLGINWDTKRLKMLYKIPETYSSGENYEDYRDYTFLSKFTTFYLGARYYTGKEFLFSGTVLFGVGVFYGFARGDLELEVKDVQINNSWYAKLMLFNVFGIAKRQTVGGYYYKGNYRLNDDKGIYVEAGLNFDVSEEIFIEFFTKYNFSLTRVYSSQNYEPYINIKDYSPRTFMLTFSFGIFFSDRKFY